MSGSSKYLMRLVPKLQKKDIHRSREDGRGRDWFGLGGERGRGRRERVRIVRVVALYFNSRLVLAPASF